MSVSKHVRHHQLGCGGWRGCPRVSDEISECDVDLVSHCTHYRHFHGGYASHHAFVIECHQVLRRAATSPQDHHIGLSHLDLLERPEDRLDRSITLHHTRREQDAHSAPTFGHAANVGKSCARLARNHAHHMRKFGQWPLTVLIGEALGNQLVTQPQQGLEQRALSCRTGHIGDPLQTPTRWIKRSSATQLHALTFYKLSRKAHRLTLVHHTVDHRVFTIILERKVQMATRRLLKPAHLAFYVTAGGRRLDGLF